MPSARCRLGNSNCHMSTSFGMTRLEFEPPTLRILGRRCNQYTTKAVLLSVLIWSLLIPWNMGAEYCSESEKDVDCFPCTECQAKNTTCHVCPVNCPNRCTQVCNDRCQNGNCKYTDDGSLKCSEGCATGATGLFCRELCPTGCADLLCYQFNSSCISCNEGLTGDNCNETALSTGASTISTLSEVSSTPVCKPPCVICKGRNQKCCTEDSGIACLPSGGDGDVEVNGEDGDAVKNVAEKMEKATLDDEAEEIEEGEGGEAASGKKKKKKKKKKESSYNLYVGASCGALSFIIGVAIIVSTIRNVHLHKHRAVIQSEQSPLESQPTESLGNRRDSCPYVEIKVFDRDCVPDHLLQAAMMISSSTEDAYGNERLWIIENDK